VLERKPKESNRIPAIEGPRNAPKLRAEVQSPETTPYVETLSGNPKFLRKIKLEDAFKGKMNSYMDSFKHEMKQETRVKEKPSPWRTSPTAVTHRTLIKSHYKGQKSS
jgi:hypothetical protein